MRAISSFVIFAVFDVQVFKRCRYQVYKLMFCTFIRIRSRPVNSRVSYAGGSKNDLLVWLEKNFNVMQYKNNVTLTYLLTHFWLGER